MCGRGWRKRGWLRKAGRGSCRYFDVVVSSIGLARWGKTWGYRKYRRMISLHIALVVP